MFLAGLAFTQRKPGGATKKYLNTVANTNNQEWIRSGMAQDITLPNSQAMPIISCMLRSLVLLNVISQGVLFPAADNAVSYSTAPKNKGSTHLTVR